MGFLKRHSDGIFFTIVGTLAAVYISLLVVVAHYGNKHNLNLTTTCQPYSVLSEYKLQGESYVVCGNKEHRTLKSK